jgi:hypothetical protein
VTDVLFRREIDSVSPSLMNYTPLNPKEWAGLVPGDRVCLRRENQVLMHGTVDDMVPDGSVFWIWFDNGAGRIALYKDDDVRVWLMEEPATSRIGTSSNGAATRP